MRRFQDVRSPLLALAALLLAACGGASGPAAATPQADVGSGSLVGAGSTFVEPFYARAFYDYTQRHPQVTVDYQGVGSGAGIQQLTKGTVDFGASDVPMTPAEVDAAGGAASLVQLPTTLGVVSIAYDLPSVPRLQLDGATLAAIYLGRVKRWDDPALGALNPGAKLPSKEITVVHRSDGSGTTYAFTDYLAKQSDDWRSKVGVAKSVQWPAGVGGKGNEGVGAAVKQTEGSIGYVELAYVVQSQLQQAFLRNRSGRFLQASEEGATAAAASRTDLSPTSFSITDAPGDRSYPIATYSWVILRSSIADAGKGRALVGLLRWLVTDGQADGKDLQYAALPKPAVDLAKGALGTVRVAGAPVPAA